MIDKFKTHINSQFGYLQKSKCLIAISGGVDSVVLAHLCYGLKLQFALAHCNFNLRDAESDADEAFVIQLGSKLNAEVFVQKFDTKAYAKQNQLSVQMAARELRYQWFTELAKQLGYDVILTAHHADDNLETFIINFLRGTGLNGLTGIPAVNANIVRPLLPFSRKSIQQYAIKNSITWRNDTSNSSRKYLRNKLRHEVVPVLKRINPQLLNSFQATLSNLNDTADIVEESLNAVAKRAIVDIDENGILYRVSEFKKVNNTKAYLFEMFKDYGFTQWNDVVTLIDAETGKYVTSNSHRLTKHREFLILSNCYSEPSEESIVITNTDFIETPIGILKFQEITNLENNTQYVIYVDADLLKFPLQLRQWQKGDVFYPFGMTGKKKLSKYLKDEKLKPNEKTNTWVLTTDDAIIWIMGSRPDNRFRITKETKRILKIELIKS